MRLKTFFIIFLIILFSQGFSLISWNQTFGGQITKIILVILTLFCLVNAKCIPRTPMNKYVISLMVIPFVSILGAYLGHNQGILIGFNATLFSLTYVFFFMLYILKIDEKKILNLCVAFGIFWTFMEVLQQFTYPHIWFATRYDTFDKAIEIRNGIYRFNMEGREFGLLLLFFSFQRYLETSRRKFLIGIIVGLVGVYMLATRQIMAAAILSLLFALLIMHKLKISTFLGLTTISLLIYANMDTLFGDYINMTKDVDDDYIRFMSYEYFGLEYNKGQLLPMLIGNGLNGTSAYGREIESLGDIGLFREDIGIVGMYSLYGLFYILTIIAFFIYILRNREYIDVYLLMYVFYMFVTTIMLHHFGYSPHHIMTLCILLYLIEKSINRHKLEY